MRFFLLPEMIQKQLTQLSRAVEIPNSGSASVKEDKIATSETAVANKNGRYFFIPGTIQKSNQAGQKGEGHYQYFTILTFLPKKSDLSRFTVSCELQKGGAVYKLTDSNNLHKNLTDLKQTQLHLSHFHLCNIILNATFFTLESIKHRICSIWPKIAIMPEENLPNLRLLFYPAAAFSFPPQKPLKCSGQKAFLSVYPPADNLRK